MIKVQLNDIVVEVRDEVQAAAFIKEGFKVVEEPKSKK